MRASRLEPSIVRHAKVRAEGCPRARATVLTGAMITILAMVAACTAKPSVPAPASTIGTRLDQPVPTSILNRPWIDQNNRTVRLSDFTGKVLVISDMMTLCQETCPLDTATLVQTARAVQAAGLGNRVQFVSITIDPNRDTPTRIKAFHDLFTPVPDDWTVLTGPPTDITALWKYFGVYDQKVPEAAPPATDWMTGKPLTYDIDHADLVFFVNGAERERFVIDGPGHVESGVPLSATLKNFLNDDGRRNLTDPDASAWTAQQALQVVSWLTGSKISG